MNDEGGEAGGSRLTGTLERVTYHNAENGYTIAKLTPKGRAYVVSIVGPLAGATVGAQLGLWGHWTTHAQYGRQFVVTNYEEQLPATVEGIRKYLGSGLIKGVGPVTAERIVDHFGLETLTMLDEAPDRVAEASGVGKKRATLIAKAWAEQREIKAIMIFLQGHGVTTGHAVRIYKAFGSTSVAVVREDPYRLAREVHGIGFLTADRIALQLGLDAASPKRLEAGLVYALSQLSDEGHTFAPRDVLVDTARRLLVREPPAPAEPIDVPVEVPMPDAVAGPPVAEISAETLDTAVDRLKASGEVIVETVGEDGALAGEGTEAAYDAVFLPPLCFAEIGVSNRLRRLLEAPETRLQRFRTADWPTVLDWVDRHLAAPLAPAQRDAVQTALASPVAILTGGPGTGKTTTLKAVLTLLGARGYRALLAAPTGRAAKRLAEATGEPAKTLHRLLEFKPAMGQLFQRNDENPLEADMVVVDEVSMVDVQLMNHLTKAIAMGTHVLLVGDVDQLPSVGPGNVLRDLIASRVIPTVALTQIFRQAEDSHIIVNAHRINQGEMPVFDPASRDFFLFPAEDAAAAADWIVQVVTRRIPQRFGLDPLADVQVLSPVHRGAAGVGTLNERLQEALNPATPGKPEVRHGGRVIRLGDKVMQIRNNYDKDVYNGDLGRVISIDGEDQELTVAFDQGAVDYEFNALDELVLAFACSTHKSQGAEYPAVVMALVPQHYMMLQRNLLYTGVTRAKRLCVLVGSKRAIAMAVKNDKVAARWTRLAARLREPGTSRVGRSAGVAAIPR